MKRALLALLLAGCPEGTTGIIDVSLAVAPSSGDLDSITRLRVTLTNPEQVVEATRTDDAFDLALEVEAGGQVGSLIVEGFLDTGDLAVTGTTPPFNVSAINARLVVFVAPPLSIGLAPSNVAPADAVAAPLPYGAVLASGSTVQVYNAYDHTNLTGVALALPRTQPALGTRADGIVYIFGGLDDTGTPTGTLQTFNTTVAPRGAQTLIGEFPDFARAGALAVPMGDDDFLVTGDPAVELVANTLVPRADLGQLGPAGASTATTTGRVAVFAGPRGIVRVTGNTAVVLDATPRPNAAVVATPFQGAAQFAVIDGSTREVITVTDSQVTVRADVLSHPYERPIATFTDRFILVAGGGDANQDVEVFDRTFEPVAVIAAPGIATPFALVGLPNGQALIGGPQLSLFTPPSPSSPERR